MEGKRTINSIKLKNILSFGSEGQEIELQPLNVLIGPNASGKSNFIEVLRLMSYLPRDIGKPISDGGGIAEWLWKGGNPNPVAEIEMLFTAAQNRHSIRHNLKFTGENYFAKIVHETIKIEGKDESEEEVYSYPNAGGQATLKPSPQQPSRRPLSPAEVAANVIVTLQQALQHQAPIATNQSILQQRKEPRLYPELYYLSELLPTFRLYDDFDVRRYSPIRQGQNPAAAGDFLEPDASNLGVVFNNLPGKIKQEITTKLTDVNVYAEEVLAKTEGGTIRVSLQEQGLYSPTLPVRLSAGTLRYLCLLMILCHPTPPALICIEEPEIGLHPDVIHKIAELLIEASQRTQLIVTTQSEFLVSALSDVPQAVIVCERDQGGTQLNRLDPESLKGWLERYSLGDLWMKGELGGTRW